MSPHPSFLPNCQYLRPDVVMLVANDGWDVRALKEARSLAASGLSVVLVGRRRSYTELARFTDEFEIDILAVPRILDAETMRLHLETGIWKRLSLTERLLSSALLAVFGWTNLKITPKRVPPPIHSDVAEKVQKRSLLLRRQAKRKRRKAPKSSGWGPWTYARRVNFKRRRATVENFTLRKLGARRMGKFAARRVGNVYFAFQYPFILAAASLNWAVRKSRALFLKGHHKALNSKSVAAGPFRFLAQKWQKLGRQTFRYSSFFLQTLEYGETIAKLNPRAIHAHDLYTLQAATRIAKWTGAKIVYDAHELEADRRAGTDKAMTEWIIKQEKTYAPRANGCVTVSHAIADEMQKTLHIERPEVVFNAPITKNPPAGWETRTLRTDLGLDADTPLFVFVGKVYDLYSSNQRVGLIIEAVARCSGYHLAIVGPMGATAAAEIAELTTRLDLSDRLHLVPPIPAEAIVSYVADADAGIYFMWPDTRNIDLTIPNKLFELSLSGLPLVVSNLTSTRWFCEHAKNAVLVSEKTPEAVAAACREAYQNAHSLKPDVPSLATLRTEFSWEAQGKRLVRFYDRLLGGSNEDRGGNPHITRS